MSFRLYLLQRATALFLTPMVVAHLAVIFYATVQGLSAASVLARTRGSDLWGAFYGLFVFAAAIHGAIGVRNVLSEWGPRPLARNERALEAIMWLVALALGALGFRAVYALVIA